MDWQNQKVLREEKSEIFYRIAKTWGKNTLNVHGLIQINEKSISSNCKINYDGNKN